MYQPKPTKGNTEWFVNDRFGMFIHWGLYALPARHEWVKQREELTDEVYTRPISSILIQCASFPANGPIWRAMPA